MTTYSDYFVSAIYAIDRNGNHFQTGWAIFDDEHGARHIDFDMRDREGCTIADLKEEAAAVCNFMNDIL